MKSHRSWMLVVCLVAVTGTCGATAPSARGQDQAAPSKKESPRVVAYRLHHLDSFSAAEMLRQLIETDSEDAAKIVPDLVNNCVVVLARRPRHEMIAEVLKLVDTEAPRVQSPEIKIIKLQHARAGELSDVMKAVAEKHDVRVAIDQRTNAVVANGSKQALSILEAVLEALDTEVPNAKRSLQPLRVRIVWLVEGREQEKLPAPTGELQGVVGELAKLGFEDLGRVSQILIHVDDQNSEFKAAGNADLGSKALRLSVEGASADVTDGGRKQPAEGQVRLKLSIEVAQHDGEKRLCSLNTDLTTSPGHSTVLGTTPLGQKSAVFVVQVLPPEK